MDWIRNNKFMAGFLAFMLIGVGGLSYLLYTSYSHYDEVSVEYNKQVQELQRLQQLKPFPDNKGLQKFTELRQNYLADVNALQTKLASYEPAPENPPLTPIQFADKLRKTVEEVSTAAQGVGMALPPNFYMGFEMYRGAPPDATVTPLLSQELDALTNLVGMLIKQRVRSLTLIKRAPLPREPGNNAQAAAASAARAGGKAAPTASELVARNAVEIAFTAQPSAFREVLNQVTSASRLYLIRAVEIKNKEMKGPLRDDPSAMQGGTEGNGQSPEPPRVDAQGVPIPPLPPKGGPALRYVVGLEQVDADLRIELVKVEPPTPTGAK